MKLSSTTIESVAPKAVHRGPKTNRKEVYGTIRDALAERIAANEALVIELEADDKPLTFRQRIERAATELGVTVYVRRSGNQIRAFKNGDLTPEQVEEAKPKKPGRKPKAETAS